MVLDTMLALIKSTTTDRIVLVSNYTQVRESQVVPQFAGVVLIGNLCIIFAADSRHV